MKKLIVAVIMLVAALALSGCAKQTDTTRYSPAFNAYIGQVAEIADTYSKAAKELQNIGNATPEQKNAAYDRAIAAYQAGKSSIEKTTPPEQTQSLKNMYLDAIQGQIDMIELQKKQGIGTGTEDPEQAEEEELKTANLMATYGRIDAFITSSEQVYNIKCLNRAAVRGAQKIKDNKYFIDKK